MAKAKSKKDKTSDHVVVIRKSDDRVSAIPIAVFKRAKYIDEGYNKASAEEIKEHLTEHFEPVETKAEEQTSKKQKKEVS